jgi:ribokinase
MPSATKKPGVVVCGSLHLDVVVNSPALPQIDETVFGSEVNYICGGKGGNQAVAAAMNGVATAFIGCIGKDEFGARLNQHLNSHHIDCSGLQEVNVASGMSVAIVDANGDYGAVVVSAANTHIDTNNLALPDHTSMVLLQNELPQRVNIEIAKQARSRDIPVMLNAAPYVALPAEFESLIDILVLNRVEAEQFYNKTLDSTDAVVNVLSTAGTSVSTVIVTLGENGLVYRNNTGRNNTGPNSAVNVHKKAACPVTVFSTHGAGDMFCGTLASQLVNKQSLDHAIDYAMATAAWYVSARLEERSAIDRASVDRLMQGST